MLTPNVRLSNRPPYSVAIQNTYDLAPSDPSLAGADSGQARRATTTTRYEPSPLPELGGGGGATGAAGLYVGAGLNGALCGLMSFFFGFFFSRPRTSRLPMICSLLC